MSDELRKIEDRMMSGEPFTFRQLQSLSVSYIDTYRVADRALQKWRRKGWITFERKGRTPIWSLTDKGKAEASPQPPKQKGEE